MLTPEEQELVAENENLIYSYMNRFGLSENEVEDWYGLLAVALCRAARGFDENRGFTFSTYAWTCLNHEVWSLHDRKHSIECKLSLDEIVPGTNGITYAETIPSEEDFEEDILNNIDKFNNKRLLYIYNRLKLQSREIVYQYFVQGRKQTDIAETMNVSRQRISYVCRKFMNDVKENFETVK